jgi:hypothetical protein
MTQENKELLLKDLYARIPYGVKGTCEGETFRTSPLYWYAEHTLEYSVNYMIMKYGWRPYLFPISSITEEQWKELTDLQIQCGLQSLGTEPTISPISISDVDTIDWLNKNHFDYRGLIEKSLAIDATGLNIY